jgi:hypothetical protein
MIALILFCVKHQSFGAGLTNVEFLIIDGLVLGTDAVEVI